MLLSHNPLPVAVVTSVIDCSHLFTMAGLVSIARLSVKFFSSHCLLGGGSKFRSRLLLFLLCCSTLLFSFQNGLSILRIPFMLIPFHGFQISVRHDETGSCQGGSSISVVLSANHSPWSRDGVGGGNLYPWGVHPDVPPVDQTPHLRIRFHVTSLVLFYKSHPNARENSNRLYSQCMFHQL